MSATGAGLVRYLRTLAAGRANDVCTDRRLLEQFVTQQEEASFATLVRRHGPMVLSVCRRVLHHDQDAEDAFQATFLLLARRAGSIRKQDSVSSWLHGVAYHVAEKLRAKQVRRTVHERKAARRPAVDPAEDVAWREIRCLLDSELARLPEQYRGPLVLCYLQGKTQDEAARQLDWSLRTFRRRLKCGRDLLVRRLTRRGVTLSAALSAPLLADAATQAALPPLLAASTVRAGLASATGQTLDGLVSAQVAALVESGVGSLLTKKASIAVVVLVSLMLGIGGLLAYYPVPSGTHAEAPPSPPSQSPPARSASKDQILSIKGRVLDPDGKPLSGAKVYLSTYTGTDKSDPRIQAETGPDGRFLFTASPAEVNRGEMVVAEARRYGPDWVSLKEAREGKELTLRLVKDDVPIQGRVLDLEARPVAGATVRLVRLRKMPGEDLTSYLKELQAKPTDRNAALDVDSRYLRITTSVLGILGSPKRVKTGPDGRFELSGLGRERVATLSIEGPGIESRFVAVITRAGLTKGLPLDRHGPLFEHLAAPSKPIRGTVREKETGKPLAGITVHARVPNNSAQMLLRDNSATTDQRGQYQIDGIAKQHEYSVSAVGRPYFPAIKSGIADTPGLEPLVVDFELERGIEISGHVVNKATGEPLRAAVVAYHVTTDHPNFKKLSGLNSGSMIRALQDFTRPDGSFAVVGYPGPGYLVVLAVEDDYRKPDPPVDLKTVAPQVRYRPALVHACVRIDPSEKDPKSTRCEIALEPAKSISGQVLDPEGKPLSSFFVAGLQGTPISVLKELDLHETPSFRVHGLDPDRPRTLAIIHPKKRLGKVITVRDDQHGPLQVRLEPLGAVAGRVLDTDGNPRSGAQVRALVSLEVKDDNLRTTISKLQSVLRRHQLDLPTKTDSEGKFHLDGLIPGLKYMLLVSESEITSRLRIVIRQNDVTVESGKTKDLGDLKIGLFHKEAQEKP